jgi:hypothetical protein
MPNSIPPANKAIIVPIKQDKTIGNTGNKNMIVIPIGMNVKSFHKITLPSEGMFKLTLF